MHTQTYCQIGLNFFNLVHIQQCYSRCFLLWKEGREIVKGVDPGNFQGWGWWATQDDTVSVPERVK